MNTLAEQVIHVLLAATQTTLDDIEFALALDTLTDIEWQCEVVPSAAHLVNAIEKAVGLGFDEDTYSAAVHAVMAVLPRPEPPPDAHLEMAYEDRFEIPGLFFD